MMQNKSVSTNLDPHQMTTYFSSPEYSASSIPRNEKIIYLPFTSK